jgi:hypothetical protein
MMTRKKFFMAELEQTLKMAGDIIEQAESAHLKNTRSQLDRAILDGDENLADNLIDKILKEGQRIDPKHKFDHEEVWRVTGHWYRGKIKR